jgi:hypothetical protein
MDWTLAEILDELRKIPGFVSFTVEVVGDNLTIKVRRRAPWRTLNGEGADMQEILRQLLENG